LTPPGCAGRPALPVSQAVSGRAVGNEIFGGCGTGVKPWRDRLMEAGDLSPVVQVGGPSHAAGPAPTAWRDGERAQDIAKLTAGHGRVQHRHRISHCDSHSFHEIMVSPQPGNADSPGTATPPVPAPMPTF